MNWVTGVAPKFNGFESYGISRLYASLRTVHLHIRQGEGTVESHDCAPFAPNVSRGSCVPKRVPLAHYDAIANGEPGLFRRTTGVGELRTTYGSRQRKGLPQAAIEITVVENSGLDEHRGHSG